MKEERLLEFVFDISKECKEKKIIVAEVDDEDLERFHVKAVGEVEDLDIIKEVVLDLVPEANNFSNSYDVTGYWVLSFDVPDNTIENYKLRHNQMDSDVMKTLKDIEVENNKDEEEFDDRKGVKVVKEDDRAKVYEDGVVEIELEPWKFEVMDPEVARHIKPMKFITTLQYGFALMIGKFLALDEFKNKEVEHPYRMSGRWMFKGTCPVGEEYFFDLHDNDGSDVPSIYANSGYGLNELYEWLKEKIDNVKPVEYKRTIKLPNRKDGTFGVNDKGEVWHDWNKCPWLERLGL